MVSLRFNHSEPHLYSRYRQSLPALGIQLSKYIDCVGVGYLLIGIHGHHSTIKTYTRWYQQTVEQVGSFNQAFFVEAFIGNYRHFDWGGFTVYWVTVVVQLYRGEILR
jgi:hypothetical protein